MAEIAVSELSGTGAAAVTETELTGSDTLGGKQGTLIIRNASASSATINLSGDGATTVGKRGVGEVDVSSGYDVEVPASESRALPFSVISDYLRGTVAVSGGASDVFASIIK